MCDSKSLVELVENVYQSLKPALSSPNLASSSRVVRAMLARSRSLTLLIGELLDRGCLAETRILVRSLLEDSLKGLWICAERSGVEGRIYRYFYWGRVRAFQAAKGKVKTKQLPEQAWWAQVDSEIRAFACELGVAHQSDPADVEPVPAWKKLLEHYPNLGALQHVYEICCSATHRDAEDLRHFVVASDLSVVDFPFGQPDIPPGVQAMRDTVNLLFLTVLDAAADLYGIDHGQHEAVAILLNGSW